MDIGSWVKVYYGRKENTKIPVPYGKIIKRKVVPDYNGAATWCTVLYLVGNQLRQRTYKLEHFQPYTPTENEIGAWMVPFWTGNISVKKLRDWRFNDL